MTGGWCGHVYVCGEGLFISGGSMPLTSDLPIPPQVPAAYNATLSPKASSRIPQLTCTFKPAPANQFTVVLSGMDRLMSNAVAQVWVHASCSGPPEVHKAHMKSLQLTCASLLWSSCPHPLMACVLLACPATGLSDREPRACEPRQGGSVAEEQDPPEVGYYGISMP